MHRNFFFKLKHEKFLIFILNEHTDTRTGSQPFGSPAGNFLPDGNQIRMQSPGETLNSQATVRI